MSKIIKEIIIMLLVCLVGMLLFAVIFYEYIPNRKIIPEVSEYKQSEQVQQLMSDDVENRNDQVVLEYKVTGSDLNNYKVKKDYVPGKTNPFGKVEDESDYVNTTTGGGNTATDSGKNIVADPGENILK